MIKEKLIQSRKKLGWTQQDLAVKSGFSRSSIINWETGKRAPRSIDIERLAETLGTSAAYLMSDTDNPASSANTDVEENKSLPVNNVESKEPENKVGLSYWGNVVDNARRIAKLGNLVDIREALGMLRMATASLNLAAGTAATA